MIQWISKTEQMPEDLKARYLTYSPVFEEYQRDHPMTYRIFTGDMIRLLRDVTHWAPITKPV